MKKFLIFDIDQTIATFDHNAGMASLQKYMQERQDVFEDSLEKRVRTFMDTFYAAFHARAKGADSQEIQKLTGLIQDASKEVNGLEDFTDVHWSRELWIYMAGGGNLSPATAVEAANAFWSGLSLATVQYGDARRFFSWLNRRFDGLNYRLSPEDRWKSVFVTSSDARLRVNRDNTKLLYDAKYSNEQKFIRVERILPISPFGPGIFIGDPVSKPHPEFWQKVIRTIGYNQEKDIAIMTGDSPRSDLTGLDKFRIVPVLIDREGNFIPPNVPHAKYVISSLEALKNIMGIETATRRE